MTYHPRSEPVRAVPASVDPGDRATANHARPAPTMPVGARSAADELSAAYARPASRYPDETFSRDLIGGVASAKLTAGLLVALVAIFFVVIARKAGVWG